ncbi:protein translocase subunit SecDF [Ichthyobacterium seriolicida]|uniref:Multifunctional fusion protein n=1 Tax=Ichthyobacterium seriolicida TaxID=242600 RepID=A0A1J1DX16_9FLAO|nr:protein translocase subunit SecDF [Ichthyobacterium seriolicida]BAV94402.1 protein-export membrane protein SecD [Ichthyobacterium seriolicida]
MKNSGFLKFFAVIFALVCVYQISFTWKVKSLEDQAKSYHKGEKFYLDSISNKPVYNFLGIVEYTYDEIKRRELNLGLDLKGGVNVILQVSVKDILKSLSNNSSNKVFNKALESAREDNIRNEFFLDEFVKQFNDIKKELNDDITLSSPHIFGNKDMIDKININSSDEDVIKVLREEIEKNIDRVFVVIRSRIDKFGVSQPNIQRLKNSSRILVELPGVKDTDRVKKILKSTAKLEFCETYNNDLLADFLISANDLLRDIVEKPTLSNEEKKSLDESKSEKEGSVDKIISDIKSKGSTPDVDEQHNPLFELLKPYNYSGVVLGYVSVKDTSAVSNYLNDPKIRSLLPHELRDVKFLWSAKTISEDNVLELYSVKKTNNKAPLEGDVIVDAAADFENNKPIVNMQMNSHGSRIWKKMTEKNKGNSIAIVLDDYVYSAPTVNTVIENGRSQISGRFLLEDANDLANILKAGKLPAPARIIQAEIVGPSLGQESIESGIKSFVFSLLVVLVWMIFYYSRGGLYSDIALLINVLFVFGILSSIGAVLTLPGIAGIILTIGMSVDANVLIYERIREEIASGKGIILAVKDGYNMAYSSILDANITTLLTGFVLFIFGTGPVKGFATTLIIGIFTSLFCAILLTRLLIEMDLKRKKNPTFSTRITVNWFKNINFDFLKNRKYGYVISSVIIVIGLFSLFTKGLNKGVDFVGGRTYIVRFDKTVDINSISKDLSEVFVEDNIKVIPEVKVFGSDNQVKITTKYKINSDESTVDSEVDELLYKGLSNHLSNSISISDFLHPGEGVDIGVLQSIKVGPSIADDIKESALLSILFSLIIIFFYILLRFRKWQFSVGALVAVFHDVLLVLSIFSIAYGYLPFSLEIDQAFIAAILTVIGYSINDTVVVFDRIREYIGLHSKLHLKDMVNRAVSSTLSRTINTSITTFFVLFAVFIFGGETIKGFMFALMVGLLVGTYSSIFIATPVMFDTTKNRKK